jgi:hypothetical protein
MKRVLVFSGLMGLMLLCGCGKKANSGPTGPGWTGFDPEQGKFSVAMPGTPEEKSLPEATGKVWTSTADGLTYSVQYKVQEFPNGTPESDAVVQIMDGDVQWSVTTKGGTIIGEPKTLSVGGQTGREVVIDDGNTLRRIRMCVAGDRLYSVTVSGPKDKVGTPEVDSFLDSFRLAK